MLNLIDEENQKKVVEEISEAIFLMIEPGKVVLCHFKEEWNEIMKTAKYITTLNSHEKPSLSSKVIFQNYDMIET